MTIPTTRLAICSIFSLCVALHIPAAQAQESALDEITVTATKRDVSSRDVPLSISATTGETLAQFNIDDLNDLSSTIPNLTVGFGITQDIVSMRGLGSGQNRSFEQSVGMFIDGIYMPRSRQYRSPFMDIERVEVVRGPQAVLFGLNSTAGAISLVTRKTKPGDPFTAELSANYEFEYGGPTITAAMGGSLSDTFAVRVAAKYQDVDGYYHNALTNEDEGDTTEKTIRVTAVWAPTDSLTITGKYETSDFETDGGVGEIYYGAATAIEPNDGVLNWVRSVDETGIGTYACANPPACSIYDGNSSGASSYPEQLIVNVDYEMDNHVLTFTAGRSEFDYELATDLDTTPIVLFASGIDEVYEQTSAEIRLTSTLDSNFDYIVGAYYQESDLLTANPNIILGNLEADNATTIDADLLSVFGTFTWHASDRTRVTAGARYVDESKSAIGDGFCGIHNPDGSFTPFDAIPNCPDPAGRGPRGTRDSTNFMPEVVVQFAPSDAHMLYAKVGLSAKSGGFVGIDEEYDDESATGYEIGVKSLLADGRLEVNADYFYTQFDDLQVNSFLVETVNGQTVTRGTTSNAAEATAQGIELDFRWSASDILAISGAASYLDTTYGSFPMGQCHTETANPAGFCDLSGLTLSYAPKYSANVAADFDIPMGGSLNFTAGAMISYSDKFFTDGSLDPNALQDSWTKVSAHIGIGAADRRWSVELIGKNLTDEVIVDMTQPFGTYFIGYIQPPKTYALHATVRFGD